MTDAIRFPKELGDVLDRALDCCFGCINAGERQSIAFLATMDMAGNITDQRIVIELVGDELQLSTDRLENDRANIRIYALAFDGRVVWEGKPQDAILIEFAERGNDESMLLAQRYEIREGCKPPFKLQERLDFVDAGRSRIYDYDKQGERAEVIAAF